MSFLFIVFFTAHSVCAAGDTEDLAQMKGHWKVTSAMRNGQQSKPEETKSQSVVIDADRMTIGADGHDEPCRIVLDSSKLPAEIEIFPLRVAHDDEKSIHGIYLLEGQTLKLAWNRNGGPRPTGFTADSGEKLSMMVLERATISAPAAAVTPAHPELHKELGIVLLNIVEFPSDETESLINTLLAEGADVNVCSGRRGYAPLHGLAGSDLWNRSTFELWQDAAAALLAAGAEVNERSNGRSAKGDTPLHVAAEEASEAQGKPESAKFIVKVAAFLIQHGADPSSRNADGKTPLDLIADLNESPFKKDLSELLLKRSERAKAIPATRPALSDVKSVALDLNECAWNVIQYPPDDAAALIECLLSAGANPHDGMGIGEALLGGLAFNAGNTWEVSNNDWRRAGVALTKAGANVNKRRSNTPLEDAIDSAASNVEFHHPTANAVEVVKFLIENGADPTIKDEQGKTPRDRAAAITDEKVRQELLNLMGKSG
jgi:uncharacterized protein (TIGR03067 family)